jgi:hypothetical protein
MSSCGGDADDGTPPANRAPVVDDVEAPAEITATNGQYVVQVRVTYHDDDNETVSKVRLQIPAGSFDQTTPIQQATPANRSAIVGIQLVASTAPPGDYEYSVSVFDERGLESAPATRTLTLK